MDRRSILKIGASGILLSYCNLFGLDSKSIIESNNDNVAVLAASGKAGFLITKECVNAGFKVTAFVRNAKKMQDLIAKNKLDSSKITIKQKDIFALDTNDLQGFSNIVDAFGEWKDLSLYKKHIEHLSKILDSTPSRLIVVGGAGSLYMDKSHTTRLMDTKDFPKEYLGVARATAESLDFLRTKQNLNWVYVSPPAEFNFNGDKTKKYKIIGEEFETNAKGKSSGSYADYALAIIDIIKDSSINKKRVGVIGL